MIRVAIALRNRLTSIGLKHLIEYFNSPISVEILECQDLCIKDTNLSHDLYFTDPYLFAWCNEYFIPRKTKVWLIVEEVEYAPGSEQRILRVSEDTETIAEAIENIISSIRKQSEESENKELSLRETQVLSLIVEGLTNKEIADKLHISFNTVLTHRKNISAKLGIKTVAGLTSYALMNGLTKNH